MGWDSQSESGEVVGREDYKPDHEFQESLDWYLYLKGLCAVCSTSEVGHPLEGD